MKRFFKWLMGQEHVEWTELFRRHLDDARVRNEFGAMIRQPEFKQIFEPFVRRCREDKVRSLAIWSVEGHEGKTLFVSLLALACAELLGERVLIVDSQTQVKSGSLHLRTIFRAEDEAIRANGAQGTFHRNIDLMISPPKDPAAFQALCSRYDRVLVDTCALKENGKNEHDPIALAKQTDGRLLVTSAKSVMSRAVSDWKAARGPAKRILFGVVYNDGVV